MTNIDEPGLEVKKHEVVEGYSTLLASAVHDGAILEIEMVVTITDLQRLLRGSTPQHMYMLDAFYKNKGFARNLWFPASCINFHQRRRLGEPRQFSGRA